MPKHLAVIMDGNGRWAERRHRPRSLGHRAGAKAVRVCMEFCINRGIESLTLFAFSSENWNRPADEVGALMKLFLYMLDSEVEELHRRGVRITFIGDRKGRAFFCGCLIGNERIGSCCVHRYYPHREPSAHSRWFPSLFQSPR